MAHSEYELDKDGMDQYNENIMKNIEDLVHCVNGNNPKLLISDQYHISSSQKRSKKRSLADMNETQYDFELNQAPKKKQKLRESSISSTISSKLFLHRLDQKQFKKLFKSIRKRKLIKQLKISHDIIQLIAEYATGSIKQCDNKDCKKEIFILKEDMKIYDNTHHNANKVGFKYCHHSKKFYCKECMQFAVINNECVCYHYDQLYFEPNCSKCKRCNAIIKNCDCYTDHELTEELRKCHICNSEICAECAEVNTFTECISCNQVFCGSDCDGDYHYECYDDCHYDQECENYDYYLYEDYDHDDECEELQIFQCGQCNGRICRKCNYNRYIFSKCVACGIFCCDGCMYGSVCKKCKNKATTYCAQCETKINPYKRASGYYKSFEHCETCNGAFCRNCEEFFCLSCDEGCCEKCSKGKNEWGKYVCGDCYCDNRIECIKCNVKFELLFRSNKHLLSSDGQCRMEICEKKDCSVLICFNCDEKDRNGISMSCSHVDKCKDDNISQCNRFAGGYCKYHIPKIAYCKLHKKCFN